MLETKILKSDQIDEAINLLKNGELVALPTETVYGLAADAKNESAIQKIFIAKERPFNHPLILHISSFDQINDWAHNIPSEVKKLAEHFWPGPLTIILHKRNDVSNIITGGLDTIAIRIPNNPIILEIINKLKNGLVAPSANTHKKTSPTKIQHVLKTLNGKIAGIIDGGECNVGIESTIIDMTKKNPTILRPGSITPEMIEKILNIKVEFPIMHNEKVSGNMESHYQPEKPLFLMSIREIEDSLLKDSYNVAVIHQSPTPKINGVIYYHMPDLKSRYARSLYNVLHNIDNTNIKKILVETPPNSIEWADVYDRLIKASTK